MNLKVGTKLSGVTLFYLIVGVPSDGTLYYTLEVYNSHKAPFPKPILATHEQLEILLNNGLLIIEKFPWESEQVSENSHNCTCSSRDLFNFGCRCGGK